MTRMLSRTPRTVGAVAFSAALVLGGSQASVAVQTSASTVPSASTGVTAGAPATVAAARHDGTRVFPLTDGFRPEGITSYRNLLYASSLADGRIVGVDRFSGGRRTLLTGTAGRSLRGMQVDTRTDLLYVAGNDGPTAIVLAIDIHTGQVTKQWTIGGAGFLNDLVITRRAVWVTDSRVDRLTRLPLDRHGQPTDDDVRFVPLGSKWPVPDPNGIRANGIRALSDGTLLLDHSTAGGLWTVNPRSGAVTAVPIMGEKPITGGDGLEIRGRTVWIVRGTSQNSIPQLRLERYNGRLTAHWERDLTDPALDVPSTAVRAGHRLYAVNARFGVSNPDTATYGIVGLDLR